MQLSKEILPVLVDSAKRAIDVAATFDEVKAIHNQAEVMRQYAKSINAGLEAQNRCAEIKIRAERRMGQELDAMEKQRPGEYQRSHDATVAPSLRDMGINQPSHGET